MIGWFCVLGWQAGVAGQSFSVGLQIQGLIALNDETYIPKNWHSTLLAIAAVSICVIFNTFLARKLPLVEGLVMVLHVLGFFAILIPLWVFAPKAPSSEVWGNFQNNAGWSSTGLAFLVGMTTAVNALIGPDSAVHMCKLLPFSQPNELLLMIPQPKRSAMPPASFRVPCFGHSS